MGTVPATCWRESCGGTVSLRSSPSPPAPCRHRDATQSRRIRKSCQDYSGRTAAARRRNCGNTNLNGFIACQCLIRLALPFLDSDLSGSHKDAAVRQPGRDKKGPFCTQITIHSTGKSRSGQYPRTGFEHGEKDV